MAEVLPPDVDKIAVVRLLLVTADDSIRDLCLRELISCSVEVVVVSHVFPISSEVDKQSFNGLLFDIKAKMEEIRHHKTEVYRLTERFPAAHLQLDNHNGRMRVFHPGPEGEKTLVGFVEKYCRHRQPLRVRNSPRKQIHLPVLVWGGGKGQRPRRLVTKDISTGGCFLVSCQRWTIGRRIRLAFSGVESLGQLQAEVRSVIPWGEGRDLPGVGVKFLALSPDQEKILRQFCDDF